MSSTANFPFFVVFISPIFSLPFPLTETTSPVFSVVLFFVIVVQFTRTSLLLIKSTSFDLEILNPALARASTLNDASTVLNDLVLGGSYSRASNGIGVHETETSPTLSSDDTI